MKKANDLVSIVDDDEAVGQAMTSLLRSNGFKVESFLSAKAFLASPHVNQTACLVLDLHMPGMNGFELQQYLTRDNARIPIIFITANGGEETRAKALQAGAIDYLAKPVGEEDLLRATRAAFENNHDDAKRDLAECFLSGLKRRDWDKFRSALSREVSWQLPGNGIISGEARGMEAVVRRAQTIASYGVNVKLKHMLIGHHGVALCLHNTARRGDLTLDEHLATVLSVSDGKIMAIDTYLSDIKMLNTFFAA